MFIRAELKEKAKHSIHQNIWICIGVALAYSLLIGNNFGVVTDIETSQMYFRVGLGTIGDISLDFITFPVTLGLAGLISLCVLIYKIFVIGPLQVGYARYYLENREAPSNFEVLFSMFHSKIYFNIVKIMLLRSLFTLAWYFLFIFPGFYKVYQYSMIPYILAENPTMDSSEVFARTKQLTKDVKFDMFILDLSFIGWYLLIFVTFGIAGFYVIPYEAATMCELYCWLRDCRTENIIMEEKEYVEPTIDNLH